MSQGFAAMDRAISEIQSRARRTAAYMTKVRARRYRDQPMQMETVMPGLASACGNRLIAAGHHFLEFERKTPVRHFGFGGEVGAVNAKAIILLGRYRRRFG